jgi:hypothetical protein
MEYQNQLTALSRKIDVMRLRREAEQKAQHAHFNVFTTLLKAGDEVRLHTRFLFMLLNEKGKHDCERLFIELFCDVLSELGAINHAGEAFVFPTSDGGVAGFGLKEFFRGLKADKIIHANNEEARGDYGRFDLYFEYENHIVLIENKVWAREQDEQVEKYAKFLKEQKPGKKALLLYLTLDGKEAQTAAKQPYARISYSSHILAWLDKCLQATYAFVNINQTIQQYKQVVERLTGQNQFGEKQMSEIKDYLCKNPSLLQNVDAINKAASELHAETLKRFFDELLGKLLEEKIEHQERAKMANKGFLADSWGGYVLRPERFKFVAGPQVELWLERSDPWKKIYIGLEVRWQKKGPSADELRTLSQISAIVKGKIKEVDEEHLEQTWTWSKDANEWPLGRMLVLSGFDPWNKNFLIKMLDEKKWDMQMQTALKRIRTYIRILREALEEVGAESTPSAMQQPTTING